MPTRPGCATPQIRFLHVAPRFWIGLPPDPASRRRPCPSPILRLREHLVRGLSPRQFCAMPGTHVRHEERAWSVAECASPSTSLLERLSFNGHQGLKCYHWRVNWFIKYSLSSYYCHRRNNYTARVSDD